MVVDTSAVVAILQGEPAAGRLALAVRGAAERRISAASVVEAGVVMLRRFGADAERQLDVLLGELKIETIPLTADHAGIARDAYRRFGKGRHAAALNYGDSFSYALARALGEPLLFVGGDFSRTDIDVAPY